MSSILNEKIGICYSCSGESYRESAVFQLENNYFDDDNLYYFIITDDKSYFKDIKRKNVIVNEVKDFYEEYPFIEKYEALIESTDKSDYAKKFVDNNYVYSFSLMRLHLLQAYKEGISNVSLMCTDTYLDFNLFDQSLLENKNTIYNAISEWDKDISNNYMHIIVDRLKEKHNLQSDEVVRVLDAAGRLFIFESVDYMKRFFDIWNEIIEYLFDNDYIKHFRGSYVYHDEYILAPIYNVFGLNKMYTHSSIRFLIVKHNQVKERFWNLGSSDLGYQEHTDYNEFLRINNLIDG